MHADIDMGQNVSGKGCINTYRRGRERKKRDRDGKDKKKEV